MGPYIHSRLSVQSFVHLENDIKFESLGFDGFFFDLEITFHATSMIYASLDIKEHFNVLTPKLLVLYRDGSRI